MILLLKSYPETGKITLVKAKLNYTIENVETEYKVHD